MSRPRLFFHIHDAHIERALLKSTAAKAFVMTKSNHVDSWIKQMHAENFDLAVIQLDTFNQRDAQAFIETLDLLSLEFIFLSAGEPNTHVDKVMLTSAGYHFRAPFDFSQIELAIDDVLADLSRGEADAFQVDSSDLNQYGLLIGSSKPMRKLYRTIRKVAVTDASVLIVGESGSGKELVANTIHLASARAEKPFVAVNCGALSPELVDSELFGHVKGAFTGAHKDHVGVFEQAETGTLFLDEITEMPVEHQVKLLRVLETGEYRPVGSSKVRKANVRVLAATNRDINEVIQQETFREDLYFRLSHFPISVPSLRERGDDIVGLAKHFLAYRNANDIQAKSIESGALELLTKHTWPGNVRELKHVIERAFILADEIIQTEHLILDQVSASENVDQQSVPIGMSLDEIEKIAIEQSLEHHAGNKTETAQQLGISVKTLYNKLDKYQDD